MDSLLYPTYFPNIAHFATIINANRLYLEICDNYQKQTYRNRTEIYGANGKLALTVPVAYTQKNRQLYRDVRIANDNEWQKLHLKSLESAYRMSPFFEYYIDDLMPLFKDEFDFILDLNLTCFDILQSCLQLDLDISFTQSFMKDIDYLEDYRNLVNRNHSDYTNSTYTQVFSQKHGFISNLSILDLLFNEGPNTELYLQNQPKQ